MLKDLLNDDVILLNQDAETWEDALSLGGKLLEDKKIIDSQYTDSMIQAVKDLGPYIVIAPGIALGHAKPGVYVNNIGISLVTFNRPIIFHHEANDPVSILFTLSATDSNSHLQLLSDLVNFLGNQNNVDYLNNVNDVHELIDYIKEVS